MLTRAATVVQVLQNLFYVLLHLLVVAAVILSFKFYCTFYCKFYFTCDRSLTTLPPPQPLCIPDARACRCAATDDDFFRSGHGAYRAVVVYLPTLSLLRRTILQLPICYCRPTVVGMVINKCAVCITGQQDDCAPPDSDWPTTLPPF